MKKRLRCKAETEKDEEGDVSSSGTPVKDKENLSPRPSLMDDNHHKYMALLTDFDSNVAMIKKDIITQSQVTDESLTLPFFNAIMKMPPQIKNTKWIDFKKMRLNLLKSDANDAHTFAIPSGPSTRETPALRSSSRLAKNKMPVITPKFDPSTTAVISKRLPKPGEMLVSLKGSPVAIPNPVPFTARGVSNLAITDDNDVLAALLNNSETLTNAFKDKNTCQAIVKAYNSLKKRKE